jgi:hypothetical protein
VRTEFGRPWASIRVSVRIRSLESAERTAIGRRLVRGQGPGIGKGDDLGKKPWPDQEARGKVDIGGGGAVSGWTLVTELVEAGGIIR